MTNNELKHYGILGMKWGRRRSDAELARARSSSEPRQRSEYENKLATKGKIAADGVINAVGGKLAFHLAGSALCLAGKKHTGEYVKSLGNVAVVASAVDTTVRLFKNNSSNKSA